MDVSLIPNCRGCSNLGPYTKCPFKDPIAVGCAVCSHCGYHNTFGKTFADTLEWEPLETPDSLLDHLLSP